MFGKDGIPTHIRIVRATGLGLDELAVAAVSQYVFEPASEFGTPVEIELNVEVNFQGL
jgi:protein TonB